MDKYYSDEYKKIAQAVVQENETLRTTVDALTVAVEQALSALEICGPGNSKAQNLSQSGYARAVLRDALRKYTEVCNHE